ncbi:MAG: hypothetical protein ACK4PR_12545, partial [Gammaproteobacteria bacterium]
MDVTELNKVFDFFNTPVYWKNKHGQFLGCNPAFAVIACLAIPTDIIGKTDADTPWSSHSSVNFASDQLVIQKNKGMMTKENGHLIYKMPFYDANNDIIGTIGIYIDVTEYVTTSEKSFHTLEEIISVLPGHVYWKNTDCILQGCNNGQAFDIGLQSRHDIVGKNAYDLLFQDQDESAKREQAAITDAIDKAIMEANKPETVEEFTVNSDGSKTYWLSN